MNYQDGKFIVNNLHLTNKELAKYLGLTESQVTNYLSRNRVKRNQTELEKIKSKVGAAQRGENNPNWKNGISKNHYHYKKIQVDRHREKIKARQLVHYHKKTGKITPAACEECGATEYIQAHHPDYLQPLNVVWLCRDCHRELHQKELEQGWGRSKKSLQLFGQLNLFGANDFF